MALHLSSGGTSAVTLSISGMTCNGCVRSVTQVLSKVTGVTRVAVDLAGGSAVIEGTALPEALAEAVAAAGFGVARS